MDKACEINFTIEIARYTDFEFLDLKPRIIEGKIRIDTLAKSTNS